VFALYLMQLDNIFKKWVENSCFFLNYKKLDSYTSVRSISRSAYVIKARKEVLTNFKWNFKNINPNGGNLFPQILLFFCYSFVIFQHNLYLGKGLIFFLILATFCNLRKRFGAFYFCYRIYFFMLLILLCFI
jgi:hypothetical protein